MTIPRRGVSPLPDTASATEPILDYRQPPADKSNMAKYHFGGFERRLYPVRKFQSATERRLCAILERRAAQFAVR